jgi:hypothetical protein
LKDGSRMTEDLKMTLKTVTQYFLSFGLAVLWGVGRGWVWTDYATFAIIFGVSVAAIGFVGTCGHAIRSRTNSHGIEHGAKS